MIDDFFRVTPRSRKIKLKKRTGVLFSNPGGVKRAIFYGGTGLFCLAMVYAVYLYWPIGRALINYRLNSISSNSTEIVPTPTLGPSTEEKNGYTITIPKIMAYANVVENVSPFNAKEYLKVLENEVVAQAKDTSVPGMGPGHTTYIFAHSTSQGLNMLRKNAVFYLLGEMKIGDVFFIVRNGKNYTYRVYQQKVINANQIEYLDYHDPEKEVVILQTCWPIGTDWKRLLIFAEPLTK